MELHQHNIYKAGGGGFRGGKIWWENSIAFGKSTSQRIYSKQRAHKIGKKQHKYGLKHALHTLDGHFRWSEHQKKKFENFDF